MELLFDLDGTLTDPLLGISRSIQHAMAALGREPPEGAALARFVGPPLRRTFGELLETADEELITRAIHLYRERFAEVGLFENAVYPDVPAALAQLAARGRRLWVVTSKPHVYARRIVEHFGLSQWFTEVYGAELDGRNSDKADLIRVVLETEGLVASQTWMIGDRALDIRAGRHNGTRTAAVLWGYGSAEELRAERPDILVGLIGDLSSHIDRANQRAGESP